MAKHLKELGKNQNGFRCLNPRLTELNSAESEMTSPQWRVFSFGPVIPKKGFQVFIKSIGEIGCWKTWLHGTLHLREAPSPVTVASRPPGRAAWPKSQVTALLGYQTSPGGGRFLG